MKPEDALQVAVMDYLRYQYPQVLSVHVANERATSPRSGALLKRKGVKAGMPDILIFSSRWMEDFSRSFYGLAIELKCGRNKPTPAQVEVIDRLGGAGWLVKVCYTFEDAKLIIDSYLK
jgi:hypothetical protein